VGTEANHNKPCGRPFEVLIHPQQRGRIVTMKQSPTEFQPNFNLNWNKEGREGRGGRREGGRRGGGRRGGEGEEEDREEEQKEEREEEEEEDDEEEKGSRRRKGE